MALSAWAPETFACPICLETLKDPTTLPCGHSYCLLCVQRHWDQTASAGFYECPQCRQRFDPRPVLARSNVLMEAMEKLRLGGHENPETSLSQSITSSSQLSPSDASQGVLYPTLPSSSPRLCPLHQQLLELYCCDEKEDICEECSLHEHKGHQVVRAEEDRERVQQELNAKIQKSIADRERIIQSILQVSQTHKSSIQKLMMDSQTFFTDVLKSIELNCSQVLELLQAHENSSSSHIDAQSYRLQQEITQLHIKQEELRRLDAIRHPATFCNLMVAVDSSAQANSGTMKIWTPESVISGVRSALEVYRQGLDDLTKTSLASIFRVVNDVAAVAQTATDGDVITSNSQLSIQNTEIKSDSTRPKVRASSTQRSQDQHKKQNCSSANTVERSAVCCVLNPAPKTREEMLKFRIEPKLDPNSAYRQIRLSDTSRKATLCAENQNYPEKPERFMYWRQVMCVEPLAGSPYYWEVEWTGQRVTVGVAYRNMARSAADDSARLGHNTKSWSLYWSGKAFFMWHAGKETALTGPKAKRIGVYVDQQEGLLAFYRVSHNQAQEICCVHTHFDGPLFPSFRFWSGVGSTITICELQ
ncbi:finTRIM family, member 86 [Triplophysa rosa]|uniref:E3 ubiquitin/ISG15 ligase TRIM25 n=1 Tax=Triplophysa rosa TaxID=992332 RepID=A0A9W7WKM6_TRIRA|nr:finTRIM family, member 86 [Triplophysa rosa]KAI7800883.1 hypothetical protein IRJ41_014526 [Triplophysa rosa]